MEDCTCVVESDLSTTYVDGNTTIVGTNFLPYVDSGPEVVAITSEASQASTTPPMPSTVQPPSLELKQFSSHLKYAYLDAE